MATTARVFLNEKSGSAGGKSGEIVRLFEARGMACEIVPLRRGIDVTKLAREAATSPGVVVVSAGGDGTVNAVAAAVAGTEYAMGVLPVGTLNHFARDLGIPLEIKAAVAVIAAGKVRVVDVCEVNGHVFVNNSSLGFYPQMVADRERLKKVGLNKWMSLTIASVRSFARFRQMTVGLEVKGERVTVRTPFLFAGNNEYRTEGAGMGTRARLDEGKLFLSMAPGLTRMGALRLSVAAVRGKMKKVTCYAEHCVTEFTVEPRRRRPTRVSLDGEVRRMAGALHYKVRVGELKVLGP